MRTRKASAVLVGSMALVFIGASVAAGLVGQPTTWQGFTLDDPNVVWEQNFDDSNMKLPAAYSDATPSGQPLYLASSYWTPGKFALETWRAAPTKWTRDNLLDSCNGWVLNASSPQPGIYDLLRSSGLTRQDKYDWLSIAMSGGNANIWNAILDNDPNALQAMTDAQFQTATGATASQRANLVSYSKTMLNCSDGWSSLQDMAGSLGMMQGMPKGNLNNVVSSYTQGSPTVANQAANHLQFEADQVATTRAGHYYAATVWLAAENPKTGTGLGLWPSNAIAANAATRTDPKVVVSLLADNMVGWTNQYSLNVFEQAALGNPNIWKFPSPNGVISPTWGGSLLMLATNLQPTDTFLASADGQALGVRVENLETGGMGNDAAFDNPQILDVTPNLTKSFDPPKVAAGQTSTLTIAVLNTSDLLTKKHWSYTDTLPDGLTVAPNPNLTTNCQVAPQVTAAPGANTVSATGDLLLGESGCIVKVDVVSSIAGNYYNGRDNLDTVGIIKPCESRLDSSDIPGCEPAKLTVVEPQVTGLDVYKSDEGIGPLAGAVFAVYTDESVALEAASIGLEAGGSAPQGAVAFDDGNGGTFSTLTSADDGMIHVPDLKWVLPEDEDVLGPNLTYYLVELQAPDGFQRETRPISFTLTAPNDPSTVDVTVLNCLTGKFPTDTDGDGIADACAFEVEMPFTGAGQQFPWVAAGVAFLVLVGGACAYQAFGYRRLTTAMQVGGAK